MSDDLSDLFNRKEGSLLGSEQGEEIAGHNGPEWEGGYLSTADQAVLDWALSERHLDAENVRASGRQKRVSVFLVLWYLSCW